jgi:hypothetical protein
LTRQSKQLGRRINTNHVTTAAGETHRDRGLATPDVQHANMLLNVDVGEQLTNDELLPNGIAR